VTDLQVDRGYVVETARCLPEHVAQVGGKAVGLGRLLRAGQRVPNSFVVSAAAYSVWARSEPRGVSAEARGAIKDGYRKLCEDRSGDVAVAVRSSAAIEDSSEASCAGQFRTFLGASGPAEVVDQVEQCWSAAFAPHVDSYRTERLGEAGPDEADAVAVIVQELVDARAAGVMFTQHPRTGDRSLVVIEASYGLGEAVVGGEVTPDLFAVNKITRQLHERSLGSKPYEHRIAPGTHAVTTLEVSPARQLEWAVDEAEILALVAMAAELEEKLGRGLDVEWAIGTAGGGEELFALQVRPITVDPHRGGIECGPQSDAIDIILGRLAGKAGTATAEGRPGS
jgi:phosphoenolpyruvate synthase/pyruvate phosphate dikinase